ncbi:hypothetical protein BDF20DRAFT_833765 [Mycotypha africana]|uniref:uncharacterized protein n=1 Tax=Mycotypha africana TaxID=64632 RepID=UPI002300B8AB|nr:uncharacterized protein BDF20DRAFT_833765 [Mycotypha africana]KAI8984239.1 hypothetical protein BDF20DRAFT_833765 [Mycotypha africana]
MYFLIFVFDQIRVISVLFMQAMQASFHFRLHDDFAAEYYNKFCTGNSILRKCSLEMEAACGRCFAQPLLRKPIWIMNIQNGLLLNILMLFVHDLLLERERAISAFINKFVLLKLMTNPQNIFRNVEKVHYISNKNLQLYALYAFCTDLKKSLNQRFRSRLRDKTHIYRGQCIHRGEKFGVVEGHGQNTLVDHTNAIIFHNESTDTTVSVKFVNLRHGKA